ncbi:hypothetical protein ATJ88_0399 [Isoptericola jiangsuensis]|uniref:Uncharacterized protein n=1 Tax=Isoptericola jiangsuensis TaxID=548579 RepID=A0A2A9ERK4_9MICO|nr:hypothetical protein [Isoptericola jiangsuensis]PFG41757.1 hypothetical protein ATJ88_0399 [Isoptericola jiangsuensis]
MLITIDTRDASTTVRGDADPSAPTPATDAGLPAHEAVGPGAADAAGLPTEAADGGAPPDWLVEAVALAAAADSDDGDGSPGAADDDAEDAGSAPTT